MCKNSNMNRVALALALGMMAVPGAYAGEHDHHAMHHDHMAMSQDHSMHQMTDMGAIVIGKATYVIPDVMLTGTDGARVSLRSELDREGPVMLNFIYTSCTTICPTMTATFAQTREKLAAENSKVRMISISIDPEHDTPERLKAYGQNFHAGPDWQFLTGSLTDSLAVQQAFNAYRGNKMNHAPLTLLRASPGESWVRIDGFASAAQLVGEYKKLTLGKMVSRK